MVHLESGAAFCQNAAKVTSFIGRLVLLTGQAQSMHTLLEVAGSMAISRVFFSIARDSFLHSRWLGVGFLLC